MFKLFVTIFLMNNPGQPAQELTYDSLEACEARIVEISEHEAMATPLIEVDKGQYFIQWNYNGVEGSYLMTCREVE